jgi:long-chain acyl-CoA synthetase
VLNVDAATTTLPDTPIDDESLGNGMLYSSGTTGRPKASCGHYRSSRQGSACPPTSLSAIWKFREGLIYLSPAPLYHAAPHLGVNLTIRMGGTAIIMEHFDAAQFLQLIEDYRVTHTQLVPTMFSRLLDPNDGPPPPTHAQVLPPGGRGALPTAAIDHRGEPAIALDGG